MLHLNRILLPWLICFLSIDFERTGDASKEFILFLTDELMLRLNNLGPFLSLILPRQLHKDLLMILHNSRTSQ